MNFSRRYNFNKVIPLQIDSMTPELRNALWNPISVSLWDIKRSHFTDEMLIIHIWLHCLELHIDDFYNHNHYGIKEIIKNYFLNEFLWWRAYDFIESVAQYLSDQPKQLEFFQVMNNDILERHNSAYRLYNNHVIRVTEPALIASIEEIHNNPEIGSSVKEELSKSIVKLSERGDSQNRYAYNESAEAAIHMLEAYLKVKTGEAKLSDGIKALKKAKKIEKTFYNALEKLYAFANDQVRHAIKADDSQIILQYSDALYILHLSLALVNYLEYPGQLFKLADIVIPNDIPNI